MVGYRGRSYVIRTARSPLCLSAGRRPRIMVSMNFQGRMKLTELCPKSICRSHSLASPVYYQAAMTGIEEAVAQLFFG